jgi:hypothetical protein
MRSRNIKPSFFVNEVLGELPFEVRLLFVGLWCMADREGRLPDTPKRMRGELFPYDDVDVDVALDALVVGGFIVRYVMNEKKLIQVVNFLKHQNPHRKEAKSVLPPQNADQGNEGEGGSLPGKEPILAGDGPADPGFLIPDSSYSLGEGDGDSPRVSVREELSPPSAHTASVSTTDEIVALRAAYAKAMADAGVTPVNPMHPGFARMAHAGVLVEEVAATAREKVAKGKTEPNYIMKTIIGRRHDAARLDGVPHGVKPMPRSAAHKLYVPEARSRSPAEMPAIAKDLAKKLGVIVEEKPIDEAKRKEQ